jgi:hypothetical protein
LLLLAARKTMPKDGDLFWRNLSAASSFTHLLSPSPLLLCSKGVASLLDLVLGLWGALKIDILDILPWLM